ncbi:MAG: TolC family protein [Muribaculaceae bacterium]|nr:TolC family protein [Muribaculaceae bacterium]MDE6130156.1 TolC family protein [Muribaculaceae bacterium]
MNRQLLFILFLIGFSAVGAASRPMPMSLDEAISLARVRSVDAAEALDELSTAYWQWRSYRADQLPELSFDATLPSYSKQYSAYMNGQGEYSFVSNNFLEATGKLSLTQNVRLTGARVSLSTSLDWLRQFGAGASNRFMSIPVALTLEQPVFGTNHMRWSSRIEPVRYSEAKAAFLSATEDVGRMAVQYYFSLLLSNENLRIAEQNLSTAARLYDVAKEKRRMGQISENDLLQMELNLLDARSDHTDCLSAAKADMFNLRSFLDLDEDVEIVPEIPESVPRVEITFADALDRALANNKFARNMMRRQLEADYEVAKAKGDLRQISLFAQVGYTGTDTGLDGAYSRLRSNQVASIGVSIPLLDWGKRRGAVKVAESNRRVTESRLRRESMNFNQELFILVERFCNQQSQLDIAARASEIADKRYDTNVQTYLIGRISTLDLNDSQSKKDSARRQYVNELYLFWSYWYQLRSLTLYDYQYHSDINADIERILRSRQ